MAVPPRAALAAVARGQPSVIPGRCEASNPESRDTSMCNCTSKAGPSDHPGTKSRAPRDLLPLAGEIFRRDGPFVALARLQSLPVGGDIGPEILVPPDGLGDSQRIAD